MDKVMITICNYDAIPTEKYLEDCIKKFSSFNVEVEAKAVTKYDYIFNLTGTIDDLRKLIYECLQFRGYYHIEQVVDKETMKILGIEHDTAFDDLMKDK